VVTVCINEVTERATGGVGVRVQLAGRVKYIPSFYVCVIG